MTERGNMADERATNERPVAAVADTFLSFESDTGVVQVPVYANRAWDRPSPGIRRAVLMLHGRLRNADAYFAMAEQALAAFRSAHGAEQGVRIEETVVPETTVAPSDPSGLAMPTVPTTAAEEAILLLAPQFLADADVQAHALDANTLRWEWTSWMGGDAALGPAPVSAFAVLDAILTILADRTRFPDLSDVVVAGHSGGAQVVHRYAVLGRGEASLAARGVATRYVVANPSSYVYFDALRPYGEAGFRAFDRAVCPNFNEWKYGLEALPGYARGAAGLPDAGTLEAAYARRQVVLLLGQEDCDPSHAALDRSGAAAAQGPHRLARGRAFARYMQMRHPNATTHPVFEIPGAGHDADAVFCSPQGLTSLFGPMPVSGDTAK